MPEPLATGEELDEPAAFPPEPLATRGDVDVEAELAIQLKRLACPTPRSVVFFEVFVLRGFDALASEV